MNFLLNALGSSESAMMAFIRVIGIKPFNFWIILGFIGQAMFTARFWIQWIASEKKGKSVIPIHFWYLSIAGSSIVLAYAIYRLDPVFIAAYCTGNFIYIRNLILIYRHKKRTEGAVP